MAKRKMSREDKTREAELFQEARQDIQKHLPELTTEQAGLVAELMVHQFYRGLSCGAFLAGGMRTQFSQEHPVAGILDGFVHSIKRMTPVSRHGVLSLTKLSVD